MSVRSLNSVSSISFPLQVVARIATAVVGSYLVVWGFMALTLSGCYALGMPFHDAESLSSILGFLVYLILFLWVFAVRSLGRMCVILILGGVLMTAAASLIQHWLV